MSILLAVSLHALADATQLTFSKIEGKIYVETDPKHFAMFGQVKDKDGIRAISTDEETQYHLTEKCEIGNTYVDKIDADTRYKYCQVIENHLEETRRPGESPKSYIWTNTFSSEQSDYSVVRLDPETLVYSSQYFPSKLGRVIISGPVVIFVHYDKSIALKTIGCLDPNERILVRGLNKINPETKKSVLSATGDKILKKHLKQNSIDEPKFYLEQKFAWTDSDNIDARAAIFYQSRRQH